MSIADINLLDVTYHRFPSIHEIIHEEFGAIERLNL